MAERAFGAHHVLRHAPLHQRALRIGEGVQHVALGARERSLIGGLFLAFERAPNLLLRISRIDRNGRLLVGEEQPVAVLLGQIPPGTIDVEAERGRDVAQVLAMPGGRPGGDGTLADRQRVVRHHRLLGDLIDPAEAMASGTGPLRGIGRERLGIEDRLAARIVSGAGIKHAQEVGQGRDTAHGGARGRRAALLLQRDGRRQAIDVVHIGDGHLMEQSPRIGRHRLEISPLRLGIKGSEGERRLSGTGDARKHHQGVARNVEIDILEIVLAGPADADKASSFPHGRRRSELAVLWHCVARRDIGSAMI